MGEKLFSSYCPNLLDNIMIKIYSIPNDRESLEDEEALLNEISSPSREIPENDEAI
jgi:hypothetical protein